MLKAFDRKFGKEFLESLPRSPGVYLVYGTNGALIYVGKAKNLKRRISQYRRARRIKKHHKMRAIVKEAERIEILHCESELEALRQETLLIQEKRPKWNVAGAFYFLYPMVGLRRKEGTLEFCYTTKPEAFESLEFHGAYRSRWITGDAFFSLMDLLRYVGHRQPGRARIAGSYSYVYRFRRLPMDWDAGWGAFFRGEGKEVLEALVLALVENAAARKAGKEIQEHLNHLSRFWRHEALPLARARRKMNFPTYPISQRERDLLFLDFAYAKSLSRLNRRGKLEQGV